MKSGVFSWYAGAAKRSLDPAPDMFPIPDPRPARDGRLFVQSAEYESCSVRVLAVGNQEKRF